MLNPDVLDRMAAELYESEKLVFDAKRNIIRIRQQLMDADDRGDVLVNHSQTVALLEVASRLIAEKAEDINRVADARRSSDLPHWPGGFPQRDGRQKINPRYVES